MDRPRIPFHKKLMNAAHMVGVVVAENDRVEFRGIEGKFGGDRWAVVARMDTAIEQNAKIAQLDDMHRAGYAPCRTPKSHRKRGLKGLRRGTSRKGGSCLINRFFLHFDILGNGKDLIGGK